MGNWYIDNEISPPSPDGLSPATAYDEIEDALDDGAFANGDTIYIKANATPYTGARNMESYNSLDNITLDRYPTDTGASRPVLDRESTDGFIMRFGFNNNITIRNMHFVGTTDPVPVSNPMMAFNAGPCDGITFEYCIFECQNHPEILEFTSGKIDNITLKYCHFISENATASHHVLRTTSAAHIGSATIEHCLFEKFKTTFHMNYNDAGETVTIDHNTFIECGGDGGEIFNLGTILDADFIATNNIFDGSSSVSVSNVFRFPSPNVGSLDEDYNDYYLFDNNYDGAGAVTHVPGVNNIAIDPDWVGGAATWEDAHITLTEYFAPVNTDYDITAGDSAGGCLGAIFVAPYTPPGPIAVEEVVIGGPYNQDGSAFFCVDSDLFKRLKSHLVDDNVYDTSDAAVGLSNSVVNFTGSIGDRVISSLTVSRWHGGEIREVAIVTPASDGSFSFSDRLVRGRAVYYAISSDGTYHSNNIYVHAYHLHVWLCAYATELVLLKNEVSKARQSAKIDDSTDFDGNVITTEGYYLAKNFGQYISTRKLETMTRAEYQQLLIDVLEAYNLGPAVEAIDLICGAFTGVVPTIKWYKDLHGFPTADADFRLRVLSAPSFNYQWDENEVYLYDRQWLVPAGSGTVSPSDVTYIYVDGTTPVGIDNRLTVLASGVRPERVEMAWQDVVASGHVRVDTYGTETGVSGELYVTTSRFPLQLTSASGSISPFDSGIDSATLTLHTSNIDLGVAQTNTDKTGAFGDITVDYTTNYEFLLIGVIHSDGSAISGIVECGRIDGSGAVAEDVNVHHHCGVIRVNDSYALSDEAKSDLLNTLKDIKPAHAFFYLYMEDTVPGAFVYYGTI